MTMEILQRQNGSKGDFYIEQNGVLLAEMTYSLSDPDIMIIDHTDVNEALRGQGAGAKMVQSAVAFARSAGKKLFPCAPLQHRYSGKTMSCTKMY